MPQFAYGEQPQFLNGQIGDRSPAAIDSLINEIVAQQTNIAGAVGAAVNGEIYNITAVGADGSSASITVVADSSETADEMITELVVAWNSDPVAAGIALAVDNTGDLDLDFVAVGVAFVVTVLDDTVTLTVTTPTAAGGADVGLAVAVAFGATDESAAALVVGSVDVDIVGMTVRNLAIQVQETPSGAIVDNQFTPGEMMSVMRQGTLIALAEDAVTKGAPVFVRKDNVSGNLVAGDPIGMPRSDVDTTSAIAMTGARFGSTTTGRGLVKIEINRPAV